MKRSRPPVRGLSLTFLRALNGWTQTDLAKATHILISQLSQYENGKVRLTQKRFDQLAAAMSTADGVGELVTSTVALLLSVVDGDAERPADDQAADLTAHERQAVLASVIHMQRALGEVLYQGAVAQVRGKRSAAAQRLAAAQWQRLALHAPAERRLVLEHGLALQTSAMCLHLCDESLAAVSRSAGEALHLAELAERVAHLATGDTRGLVRLQGYARAFVGNAHRVMGHLQLADSDFATATRLWDAGDPPRDVRLAHWRLHELEAALRWAQRDWPRAAALFEAARQDVPAADAGRLLIRQAAALRAGGQLHAALAALGEAAPRVAGQPEAQWLVLYHQVACLCQLGRHEEAGRLLPEMAGDHGGDILDLVRRMWLGVHVAACQGLRQETRGALKRIRTEFLLSGQSYEAALVTLELAILYLEQGLVDKVRTLARSTPEDFRDLPVQREVWPLMVRFCGIADAASIRLAPLRQIQRTLAHAQLPLESGPPLGVDQKDLGSAAIKPSDHGRSGGQLVAR